MRNLKVAFALFILVGVPVLNWTLGGDGVSPQEIQESIVFSGEAKGKGGDGTGPRK
jgi:hypothetical protein